MALFIHLVIGCIMEIVFTASSFQVFLVLMISESNITSMCIYIVNLTFEYVSFFLNIYK